MKWIDDKWKSTASPGKMKIILIQSIVTGTDLYTGKTHINFDLTILMNGGCVLREILDCPSRAVAKRKSISLVKRMLDEISDGIYVGD